MSSGFKLIEMKKIVLSAFLLGGSFNVFAQTASTSAVITTAPTQVSTNDEVRKLANRLELNEAEYIALRDLMKSRNEQMAEVNSMYSNDPAMRQSKTAAINKEYESNLSKSLNTKQYTAYLESQGRTAPAAGTGLEASGYGGRSLESGAATAPANTTTPATGTNGNVITNGNAVKIETGAETMKVETKKEKITTPDGTYKADKDEMKMKSADGKYKAKSEKGKTKVESPSGKMKMEDGEVKMKTKDGKVIKN